MSDQGPLGAIMALVQARRIAAINQQPGLFHLPVDDQWNVYVNPHDEPHATPNGAELLPMHFFVEFNGWPASVFHPADETITFADGEAANAETFCAAVETAIEREVS